MSIHPTAIIHPDAEIGRDVEVGAFSVIGQHVRIGDRCKIHNHVTVEGYTTLGEGCEVFPQAVLGMAPQDVKFAGEKTTLEIGKNNIIREMVTLHPGTGNGGGATKIGDNNMLLVGVHVAHDCTIGSNCIIANYVQFAGHVHLEDNVNMGGHSAVHHFVTIGQNAFIGGMTRVSADVPPYVIFVAARGPRAEVRMINSVGLQRSGYSQEDISALRAAFMRIFSRRARLRGGPIRDRVKELLSESPLNSLVENLCRFLMRSFEHGRHGRYLESLRKDEVYRPSWKINGGEDLQIEVVGEGSVSRVPQETEDKAAERIELTATASPGWQFSGWNGDLCSQDNPIQVTLSGKISVTATFTTCQ